MNYEIFFYLIVYGALLIGISYYLGLKQSSGQYLIAGRDRPFWQLFISKLAGSIGTGFFLLYTAYTYKYGWVIIVAFICFVVSYYVYARWAIPVIYEHSQEQQMHTMGDFFTYVLDNKHFGKAIDGLVVLFGTMWILTTFIGGIIIMQTITGLSYDLSLLIITTIIAMYVLLSGYQSVIVTDIIQMGVLVSLFGLILFTVFQNVNMVTVAIVSVESAPLPLIFGMIVFGFFQIFASPDRYQLVYAARDANSASKALFWVIFPYIIIFIPIIMIGLYMQMIAPGLDSGDVFMIFITQYSPEWLIGLAGVMLLSGLMSTVDTWVYAIASSVQAYIKKSGQQYTVSGARISIAVIICTLAVLSYIFRDLLDVAILSVAFILVLAPINIYVLFGGRTQSKILASVIMGITMIPVFVGYVGVVPEIILVPVLIGGLGLLWPKKWNLMQNF